MSQLDLFGTSPFDAIKHTDEHGEHWFGRELMLLAQYSQWRDFSAVIEKAKLALALVKGADQASYHFAEMRKVTEGGRWGSQTVGDYRLSRFGAYLTAMAGDDTKRAVAEARIYFAVKTREAEATDETAVLGDPLDELELATGRTAKAIAIARQERARADAAEKALAIAAPKAQQADAHRAADGLLSVPDFANELAAWAQREHGVRVLHQQVWDFLGELGLIIRGNTVRRNHPTADAVRRDFVRAKKTTYSCSTGSRTAQSPRLTPAGEGWAWDRAVKRIAESGGLTSTDVLSARRRRAIESP